MLNLKELTFDPRSHIYRLNGDPVPSVTQLMKPLSAKIYGEIDPDVLKKAAEKGTAVHQAAENFAQFGFVDIEPRLSGYMDGLLEWWEMWSPRVIATEQRVYHKILRYSGTADLLAEIDGKVTLVDYKTSVQVEHKLCAVQLEAYARAFESHGVKIDKQVILHLQKDGRWNQISYQERSRSWAVFSALMTIHNYMGGND